ncbi:hypothetical protein CLVI_26990 [Clostridium vincentii]|uniref:Uncharacterized protein n=1 Tax=Clostridium vincentii TaxID=52704 RepID=A0A2T0BBH8_9CLOT|nr:hypothetical protein CLVI_26990 [Clostridium vincentii]
MVNILAVAGPNSKYKLPYAQPAGVNNDEFIIYINYY